MLEKATPPKQPQSKHAVLDHPNHDMVMLWDGDSPHPIAIKCETCGWNGVVHDGV